MADSQWLGLVTNASPYALPAGAATEQTNLTTLVPGQLTSRGGMRPMAFGSTATETRDCHVYGTSTSTTVIALNASGQIVALSSPAAGAALGSPSNPSLSPSSGQVQSNYLGTFYSYGGEPPS